VRTVDWQDDRIVIIDKLRMPEEFRTIAIDSVDRLAEAIVKMEVHGAPAIGAAAAYGMALAARQCEGLEPADCRARLERTRQQLAGTRPTAINLFWALERMRQAAAAHLDAKGVAGIGEAMLAAAREVSEREIASSRRLAEHGLPLIPDGARVLTHCHTGPLSAVDVGLAMAPVIAAHQQGRRVHVYTGETRPKLQGARHNVWDLHQAGVPYTLVTDNSAGVLMQQGLVDMVVFGVDRMAANGDAAAKIGVYSLAVLAQHHGIPVYPILPLSSIDLSVPDGEAIPIEERDPDEVRYFHGRCITLPEAPVLNYAFDVTPNALLTAIVTDHGVVEPPFADALARLMDQAA